MGGALIAALLLTMLIGRVAYAVDTTQLNDPVLQSRYLVLTHELRCMHCQNNSLADSPAGLASDLRRDVREMLLAGKSDDQIRDFMVSRYGEFILFRPKFSVRNAWLWLGPAILLVIGAAVAVRIVRQRTALVAEDDQPVDEDEGR